MAKINDDGYLELSSVNHKVFKEALNTEKFSILRGLTPLSLRILNQASHTMHVSKGVEMMHAGDTPHDLYFINQGSVSIGRKVDDQLKVVAKICAGGFYGEYGALRGKTRFASVYTAEPSEIIRVDLTAVQQVFGADSEFHNQVYKVMQERMLSSFLFGHPVFQKLTDQAREVLSSNIEIVELERDDVLFRAGDKADLYYIILSGEAEILAEANDISTLLEVRRDNGVLGEVRGNQGSVYGYTVRAASGLDLVVLDKKTMLLFQKVSVEIMPLLNQLMNQSAKKTALMMKNIL